MFRNFNSLLNSLNSVRINRNDEEVELSALKREIRGRLQQIENEYNDDVRYITRNFSAAVADRELRRLNAKTQTRVLRLRDESHRRIEEIKNRNRRPVVSNRNVAYISDDMGNDFVINFDENVDYSGINWNRGGDGGYYHDGSWLTMW